MEVSCCKKQEISYYRGMSRTDIPHADLLAEIDAYCAASGLTRSKFGTDALNDPRFVFDLEAGRECRRATIQRALEFMKRLPKEAAQ